MTTMGSPVIEARNVTKYFAGVTALRNVTVVAGAFEVVCLLGDNGAGKSTLIKILSGVDRPSSGTILVDGHVVTFAGPHSALQLGIATVQQTGGTVPLMSVARNFFLGEEPLIGRRPLKRMDQRLASTVAVEQLRGLGITNVFSGSQLVATLSGGERQALAIARALYFGARALILDEPTAALGVKESQKVLRMVAEAKARGVAVVFVTHNVHHAMAIADRYVILLRGEMTGDYRKGEITREDLLDLMAGGESIADLESVEPNGREAMP